MELVIDGRLNTYYTCPSCGHTPLAHRTNATSSRDKRVAEMIAMLTTPVVPTTHGIDEPSVTKPTPTPPATDTNSPTSAATPMAYPPPTWGERMGKRYSVWSVRHPVTSAIAEGLLMGLIICWPMTLGGIAGAVLMLTG